MQKILVISGKKQSGKSSAANYLHGYVLREQGVIKEMGINEETGLLVVNTTKRLDNGKIVEVPGFMSFGEDRVLTDPYYVDFASKRIWPFVKRYSFADPLKKSLIELFNITVEQCYGSDEQKNSNTPIKWEYVARVFGRDQTRSIYCEMTKTALKKNEDNYGFLKKFMTARQFLQVYGSNIARAINPDCWLDATTDRILAEQVPFAIIDDARFVNEVEKSKKLELEYNVEVKTIRLQRITSSDGHYSENALDDYDDFDLVVPPDAGLDKKHELIITALTEWGWL